MKKYIWNNLKDLWLKVKKIKFVDLLSLYMDLNKHQNNDMKNLINECDKCVYIKTFSNSYVFVCLYVDDMLIMGTSKDVIMSTKKMLSSNFDMKDLGLGDVILGIQIS